MFSPRLSSHFFVSEYRVLVIIQSKAIDCHHAFLLLLLPQRMITKRVYFGRKLIFSARKFSTTNAPRKLEIPDLSDTKTAFAMKSNVDLARGVVVLLSCREFLVSRAETLLSLSQRILGRTLTNLFIRETFFRHFCAGESESEAMKTLEKLRGYGIGGILDFAAEGDISVSKRDAVSREYEYESEYICDVHMRNFETSVSAAGKGGFTAVKLTALGDAATVQKIALCVKEIQDIFYRMLSTESNKLKKLTRENYAEIHAEHFNDGKDAGFKMFEAVVKTARERFFDDDDSRNDEIDVMEWLSYVSPKEFVELKKKMRIQPSFDWTLEDTYKMERMLNRLDRICIKAKEKGVRIFIDAEHTYFQPAIDHLALQMMRKYNASEPVVYTTYQAYLKDSKDRLTFAMNLAKREKWTFATKIVRGAYMVRERALAKEQNKPSPVHDTLEDTAQSFKQCCELIIANPLGAHLCVASHNHDSCLEVLELMEKYDKRTGSVSFAQLYGMADAISFGLAAKGHPVYKYLPFGPVDQVLPYLVRRAQENSSVVAGANLEIMLLLKEFKRRIFG